MTARLIRLIAVFAALSFPIAGQAQQMDSAEAAVSQDRVSDEPEVLPVPKAPPPALPISVEEKARPSAAQPGKGPQEAARGLR